MRLIHTIPLQSVQGRIDHLSIDLKGQRLFMAALGNNTVEIVDLTASTVIYSISGLREPQGIVFVPEFNKIFVAEGEGGTCEIFDSSTFQLLIFEKSMSHLVEPMEVSGEQASLQPLL